MQVAAQEGSGELKSPGNINRKAHIRRRKDIFIIRFIGVHVRLDWVKSSIHLLGRFLVPNLNKIIFMLFKFKCLIFHEFLGLLR